MNIAQALTAALDKMAGYWMYQSSVTVALIIAGQSIIHDAQTPADAEFGKNIIFIAGIALMLHLLVFLVSAVRDSKERSEKGKS